MLLAAQVYRSLSNSTFRACPKIQHTANLSYVRPLHMIIISTGAGGGTLLRKLAP